VEAMIKMSSAVIAAVVIGYFIGIIIVIATIP